MRTATAIFIIVVTILSAPLKATIRLDPEPATAAGTLPLAVKTPSTLQGPCTVSASAPAIPLADTVWIEDAWSNPGPPPQIGGEGWVWPVDSTQRASGTASFPASLAPNSIGARELRANFAEPRPMPSPAIFVAYVLISNCDPPARGVGVEITLDDFSLRYYWGEQVVFDEVTDALTDRRINSSTVVFQGRPVRVGDVPPPGRWARLVMPESLSGPAPSISGLRLVSDGQARVWWDHIGSASAAGPPEVTAVSPRYGTTGGGTPVRVIGSEFVPGDTEVYFGTTAAAAITDVSETEMIATSPPGTGTVDVQVVTDGGTSILANAFTYLSPPTITTSSPLKGSTAGNQTIVIDGTNFVDGETTASFGNTAAASVEVLTGTRLNAVTPPHPAGLTDVAVTTPGGRATLGGSFRYFDPPAITAFSPPHGTAGTNVSISGTNFDSDPAGNVVAIGGALAPVVSAAETQLVATVPNGAPSGRISVMTAGGTALSAAGFTVLRYTGIITAPTSVSLFEGASTTLAASGVLPGGTTEPLSSGVSWSTADPSVASVDNNGAVNGVAQGSTTITATYAPYSASTDVSVLPATPLPPDPSTTAPPFEAGTAPSFEQSVAFLYGGDNPIQQGVTAGTIDSLRASVIRGRVLDRAGNPLPATRVTVADHPEYGHTVSRLDGRFDLAVNGGGSVTVRYERSRYLSAERQVRVPWRDYASVPDVVLVGLDVNVTRVTAGASVSQLARGSVVNDDDGTRRATMIFAAGTTATMALADGSTQSLPVMNVRATEYTVGPNGPKAMPATLPPQSGYTYCVELTVDEALSANAKTVQFSRPVAFYLENFLGFSTGVRVPHAYYDRDRHMWIPSPDGQVVRIIRIESGAARVDTDGDGAVDDMGIELAERQQLASLYSEGATLWRVLVSHFTPVDLNWTDSLKLPQDAITPTGRPSSFAPQSCPTTIAGSIIECENQTLGEVIPVTGSGFALHYRSDRTRGRIASRTLDIPVSGATVPASLRRIDLEVSIAGRVTMQSFTPAPNQTFRYVWDGLDAYGRVLPSGARVSVRTTYVYDGEYEFPASGQATFALASGILAGVDSREPAITTQVWQGLLGSWTADVSGMGGWTLTPHHFYDVATRTLFRGDGSRKTDVPQQLSTPNGVLQTIAGRNGVYDPQWLGAGGPARNAALDEINGTAVAPDGTIYLSAFNFIHKITASGQLVRVAGKYPAVKPLVTSTPQPAIDTHLWGARGIAVGPDGSVYVAEANLHVIRRIRPDGMIVLFAGTGAGGIGRNGVPAVTSPLSYPTDVAVGSDGSVYIAESDARRVRRVGPDGLIYTVAGTGAFGYSGEGVSATAATFGKIASIALGPDGSLYIADRYRIRRVGPDGIIRTIAGNGTQGSSGDGGPATSAMINVDETDSTFLTVTADGAVYFAEEAKIRQIDPTGIINTVAGTGGEFTDPDGGNANVSNLAEITTVTTAPDGTLYFQERFSVLLRRITSTLPTFRGNGRELAVADEGVVHVFTSAGRHLRTLHAETGGVLMHFNYVNGLLSSIVDIDGNATTITRDGNGAARAIVAPGDQHTTLAGTTYLEAITNPAGESTKFDYTPGGLMKSMTDPRTRKTTFTWDDLGLLERDGDPEGGSKTLARTETPDGHTIAITTGLGRTTSYTSEEFANGDSVRRMIDPSNLESTISTDRRWMTSMSPDGVEVVVAKVPDPVWGMQTPIARTTDINWPSGRSTAIGKSSEATFAVPGDPLTMATRTDYMSTARTTTRRFFRRSTLTETISTSGGRTLLQRLDLAGRTKRIETSGILPVDITRDSRGRMTHIVQGVRRQTFGYDTKNQLTSITDPLSRTLGLEYDGAGRLSKQILPDLREIAFTYDPAGNLSSITPAGRPAHLFEYNGFNSNTRYTPPNVAGAGATRYIFNLDRDLERIVRPDDSSITFGYDVGGRLSSMTAPDASRTFGYDAGGNVASIDGAAVALSYRYDGPTLTEMQWLGSVSGWSSGRTMGTNSQVNPSRAMSSPSGTTRTDS